MPTPEEIENYIRTLGQKGQAAGQNAINQNVDIPLQAKLKALQQASQGPQGVAPSAATPGAMNQMPSQSGPSMSNVPGGGGPMGTGTPMGFDDMDAQQAAQKRLNDAAHEAYLQQLQDQEENEEGNKNVPTTAKPRQFSTPTS